MCRSKKFVKRFHIQSQLYFRIHLLVKESNPARYAMSPPSASPRASCLSVNIGENCVLIKLFDPNVDLDFPKIGQIVFYITEIDLKGQDKLWGKIEDLQIFHICTQIQISVRSQLLNVQIQQMKLQPPKSIQNILAAVYSQLAMHRNPNLCKVLRIIWNSSIFFSQCYTAGHSGYVVSSSYQTNVK